MKKALALTLAALFAISFMAVACDDDDAASGPCEELADAMQDAIDTVCDDFPDCSLCEAVEEGEGETPTDDECQELLDAFDAQAMIDLWTTGCEAEAAI